MNESRGKSMIVRQDRLPVLTDNDIADLIPEEYKIATDENLGVVVIETKPDIPLPEKSIDSVVLVLGPESVYDDIRTAMEKAGKLDDYVLNHFEHGTPEYKDVLETHVRKPHVNPGSASKNSEMVKWIGAILYGQLSNDALLGFDMKDISMGSQMIDTYRIQGIEESQRMPLSRLKGNAVSPKDYGVAKHNGKSRYR